MLNRILGREQGEQREELARLRAENAALKAENALLNRLSAPSPLLAFVQDGDLRYVWAKGPVAAFGPGVLGLTDLDIRNGRGKNAEGFTTLHAIKGRILETGRGERHMFRLEIPGETESRLYDLVLEPHREPDGSITGIVGLGLDITVETARRGAVALAEAQAVKAEAERANRAKSRFLAAASHDLRQPFQAMRLFLHLLETRLTDDPQRDLATKLTESLDATEDLLNALVQISALEAATVTPTPTRFALSTVMERLAGEFRPLAAANGVNLRYIPTTAQVNSDPVLLDRMVRNLIVNAVRHTRKGGILIGCRRRGTTVRLQVWDTGCGIPADQLPFIFDEFYRGETVAGTPTAQGGQAKRDAQHGLGLGLAIVKKTATLLGLTVTVISTPNRGSGFTITLPLAEPVRAPAPRPVLVAEARPAAATATEPVKEPPPGTVPRPVQDPEVKEPGTVEPPVKEPSKDQPPSGVLPSGVLVALLEDDPLQLVALEAMVEDWGCVPLAASTPEALFEGLNKTDAVPRLVISDNRLPGNRRGMDVIAEIRKRYGGDVGGMLVTGDTDPQLMEQATAAGVVVVHKPIAPPRLQRLVVDALQNGTGQNGTGQDGTGAGQGRAPVAPPSGVSPGSSRIAAAARS
ncbi:hybrid sensor histidine kinase/response regulator [Nitrospirillum sp. BR 11164]|uniref:ATP-binding response regulator n=1 Tax=Nitrospirillum sp. BR 11164 TaxID=3104324 RepID=UPI002AFF03C3|nr:hybrid sensor histidine kinase/response regulator [Nitrospirillum sp. BR 11164]MEA1651455.1 hybrid sensor histidine kinase/response regulator [Nitrospirillum sp. BR 11164]